jgi:hypothetical protein
MKKIFTLFIMLLSFQSFAQQLQFSTLGGEPAYCRLYGNQNGNGVVYAAATGGTPSYTYQWTNLTTMATSSNTTWGGLNPGDYEIKAWDAAGDSIMQVITVDSVNPIAVVDITAGATSGSNPNYFGSTGVYSFSNSSLNVNNPNNPNNDTAFFWQFTQFENWLSVIGFTSQQYDYQFGGTWGCSLVALNSNDCSDTAKVYITITGPASISDYDSESFQLISNSSQSELIVTTSDLIGVREFRVYDLSGKLLLKENLSNASNFVSFSQKGLFVFEIIDPSKAVLIQSGKFTF